MKDSIVCIIIGLVIFGVGFYYGSEHEVKIMRAHHEEQGIKHFQELSACYVELNRLKANK